MEAFSRVLPVALSALRTLGNRRSARSGYGLALIMIFLVTSMMMAASLQIMNNTGGARFVTTSLSHTSAQYVAETGLQVVINDIMTQLNAGNTVTTAYTYSGSVTMPNDPTNLGGASSTVGTYTATMTAARGNSYLVKVTATVNGMQANVSRLLHMTRTTSAYILDEVPNATAAYGLRKLREGYAGSAIRVRRSSDNTEQDIGFDSDGDLDTAALTTFVGTGVIVPPLDSVGSAFVAFGLRKLRTAYTGSAIRVRRSSDSTEQDIGFDGDGNLDTSALLTFVGSGSGYVKTWYDQSGNGRNATMSTASYQPRIVNAGTLDTVNSKPAVYFDGTSDYLATAAAAYPASSSARTMNVVHKMNSTGYEGDLIGWGSASSGNQSVSHFCSYEGGLSFYGYNYDLFTTGGYDTSQHVWINKFSGSTMYVYVDGILKGSTSMTLYTTSNTALKIGYFWDYARAYISEVIIYASSLSAGNQTTLESNQDQYYISGGSANGYVTTWYDQSGNGRNLTQATTGYQPRIVNNGTVDTKNGLPAIYFDGTDDRLTILGSNYVTGKAMTALAVANATSLTNGFASIVSGWSSAQSYCWNNNVSVCLLYTNTTNALRNQKDSTLASVSGVNADTVFQASSFLDGAANTRNVALDGTLGTAIATVNSNLDIDYLQVGMFGGYTTANYAWLGHIMEVILYPTNLSTTDRQTVENDQMSYY